MSGDQGHGTARGHLLTYCPGTLRFQTIYCDAPQHGASAKAAATAKILFAIATIFTFLRLLARIPVLGGGGLGGDDYLAAFLWVVYMVVTVLLLTPGEFYIHHVHDLADVGYNANPICPRRL
jgi:hypothetical protein